MPTQRLEEKRVEECVGEGEREGEREKEPGTRERKRERKRVGFSFYMLLLPPGPALCKLGLAGRALCST